MQLARVKANTVIQSNDISEEEYQKALKWTKEHCKMGRDDNPDFVRFSDEEKEKQWEFTEEEKEG